MVQLPKKELQRTLHNSSPQVPFGRHFTSKTVFPEKSYSVALGNCLLEISPIDSHRQKDTAKQAPKKCTDGDLVTSITAVQQIMTCLQIADTE
jgi:hypothetical protein